MTQLTYGSLFSGIGGIDLGLDRVGMHCKWQVEIDSYAQKVLAKHWPNVVRYGDIRECGAHNLESVDLICGGFPCQDISVAGKRAGITGERSGLWKEFYRVVCELRPHFVLVENVPALLYGGIDTVLGDLAESGYDAEWQIISAETFGAPHLRERVFIVGYPMRIRCGWQGLQHNTGAFTGERSQNVSSLPNTNSTRGKSRCKEPSRSIFIKRNMERATWWTVEPNVGRVAHGVPSRVDRLRGLGNAVVPQVAEYVGRCILAAIEAKEVAG